MKLICVFVFSYAKNGFSHNTAQMLGNLSNMRKPAFCICKNKDTDQQCCNPKADERLCFHYIDSKTLMEIKGFLQCIAANKQQVCGLAAAASCGMVAACEFLVN